MLGDCLWVEEEATTDETLIQEVASESGNPLEDGEPSASLENEHGDDLLEEKSNNDGGPRSSPR